MSAAMPGSLAAQRRSGGQAALRNPNGPALHLADTLIASRREPMYADLERVAGLHGDLRPQQEDRFIERITFHDPSLADRLRAGAYRELIF